MVSVKNKGQSTGQVRRKRAPRQSCSSASISLRLGDKRALIEQLAASRQMTLNALCVELVIAGLKTV
jgi:hypothetical protein